MQAMPPLRALQVFRHAANAMSFKEAAKAMNISQAAVSSHIRKLEAFLGLSLFERLTRQVRLTREGRELLTYVEAGFQELEKGIANFSADPYPDRLTVTTIPSFASRWLVTRLEKFQSLYPRLTISLIPNWHLANFREDGIDIAIRFGKGNYENLTSIKLLDETLLPVCHPDLVGGQKVTPEALTQLPWLLDDSDDMAGPWRALQETIGVEIPDDSVKVRVTESSTLVEAILGGHGISLLRYSLVYELLESGLLFCPFDVSLPADYQYYLVAPEAKFRSPKVRAFVSWITAEVQSVAASPGEHGTGT